MSDTNTDDSFVPTEPTSRPANVNFAIDQMLSARVNTDTGVVEHLRTVKTESAHSSGDVTPATAIPDAAEFVAEIQAHVARAATIQAQLDAVTYSKDTGKPVGPKVPDGPQREQLKAQLKIISQEIEYTDARARQMLPLRGQQQAAKAAASNADARANAEAGAKREAAIAQLSEQRVNGKPMGRVAATKAFDEAAARALADKLARS